MVDEQNYPMSNQPQSRRGQSLVAMALIAPVLVIILVGLIEVTQLAVTQNRISTAARNAARYGANGGEDAGMRNTVLNTITNTLIMSSGVWDVWSVRAEVNSSGDIPTDTFQFVHIYGDGLTGDYGTVNAPQFEDDLRLKMQDELRKDGTGAVVGNLGADLSVVGVYILHDIETMLGLNVLPNLTGFNTVTGFSFMRRVSLAESVYTTDGCRGVFPIAVEEHVQTILRAPYESLTFTYPAVKPIWETFSGQPTSPTALRSAKEGNIFKLDLGTGNADFNWLRWNGQIVSINPPPVNHGILATSLIWPGNSADYEDRGDLPSSGTFRGYANAADASDHEMHQGDWIHQDQLTGPTALDGLALELQSLIDKDRAVRLLLWDSSAGGYTPHRFKASGFGIFRIVAYGTDWILLELVRIDTSCGQN